MDATRLRALIDGALESQRLLDETEKARTDADAAQVRARERHRTEVGSLRAALDGAFVVFGDRVVRVGPAEGGGQRVYECPLVTVPVLAPPPPPLPEADPPTPRSAITSEDIAATALNKGAQPKVTAEAKQPVGPPLAAGKVPTLGKK